VQTPAIGRPCGTEQSPAQTAAIPGGAGGADDEPEWPHDLQLRKTRCSRTMWIQREAPELLTELGPAGLGTHGIDRLADPREEVRSRQLWTPAPPMKASFQPPTQH
jgi:hypothetical protein